MKNTFYVIILLFITILIFMSCDNNSNKYPPTNKAEIISTYWIPELEVVQFVIKTYVDDNYTCPQLNTVLTRKDTIIINVDPHILYQRILPNKHLLNWANGDTEHYAGMLLKKEFESGEFDLKKIYLGDTNLQKWINKNF